MTRVLPITLALLMIGCNASLAWGAAKTSTQKSNSFGNITIETSGNQDYDLESNIVTAPEHVVITMDNGVVIEADSLVYYGKKNLTVATGNVKLTKQTVKLTAAKLTYQDLTGDAVATGNAHLSSPKESYDSETIRYNMNTLLGNVGPFRGVIKSGGKDYYLTGNNADLESDTTTITPAGLTRCPLKEHPDYIFKCKKMKMTGNVIRMEKVWVKVLNVPVLYLPKLTLRQSDEAPRFDMNSNAGDEPDLSSTGDSGNAGVKELRSSWYYRIEANTTRPAMIALGRMYAWNRYSNRIDCAINTNGIFSFEDEYGVDWKKYHLAFDGKSDLTADPERELGITFNRKTWDTGYGLLKAGLVTRLLYTEEGQDNYQGVYGGTRLDYQPFSLVSFTYLYLKDVAGNEQDWDKIESDFMVIKNYRLGNNVMFASNIPLSTHWSILYKGSYHFDDSSWTSQVLGITREVCCVKSGLGWDFAKELVELRFKLNY